MNNKRLYVINSPCYVENHPSHTCGQVLIEDPLSEHYTYLYYNLIIYGLVDEVIIFPREGKHDAHKDQIQSKIDICEGKSIQLNWDRQQMYEIINSDPGSFVYSWGKFEDCDKIKNNFVIINPVVVATNSNNCLSSKIHDYALLESLNHEKTFKILPNDIPFSVFPTTSKRFTELNVQSIQEVKKAYDWIIVSSTDPRKRHLEFLDAIQKNPKFRNTRGCIAARNPDNKGHVHSGHYVLNSVIEKYVNGTKNVDLFINTNNDLKIDLLSKSKIFICTSVFDVGPRAVVEAIQAGLPVLSMPHIGASTWVYPGQNGELVENISECTETFYQMLERYDQGNYLEHSKIVSEQVKPDKIYPAIAEEIKKSYNRKFQIR